MIYQLNLIVNFYVVISVQHAKIQEKIAHVI